MTKTKLNHRFDIAKIGHTTPLAGVQITVIYDPETGEVVLSNAIVYGFISRSSIGINQYPEFVKGMIQDEMNHVDWKQVYHRETMRQHRVNDIAKFIHA